MRRFVVLQGTWVREDTFPEELTGIRKLTYRMNREFAAEGSPERRHFHAKHGAEKGSRKAQTREGTFTACVKVETDGWFDARTAISRAKELLRWHVRDITCRAPKLTFTDAWTGTHL